MKNAPGVSRGVGVAGSGGAFFNYKRYSATFVTTPDGSLVSTSQAPAIGEVVKLRKNGIKLSSIACIAFLTVGSVKQRERDSSTVTRRGDDDSEAGSSEITDDVTNAGSPVLSDCISPVTWLGGR